MNNKGFTLVELLIVISILAVMVIIAVPTIQGIVDVINNKSYDLFLTNLNNASSTYYQECEIITISDCNKTDDGYIVSLSTLANYGLLTSNQNNIVYNPKTKENISNCQISITKTNDNYQIKDINCSIVGA